VTSELIDSLDLNMDT